MVCILDKLLRTNCSLLFFLANAHSYVILQDILMVLLLIHSDSHQGNTTLY